MRFWLFVFVLMIGVWVYYLVKPYFSSSATRIAELVRENLRAELKGTEWRMEDGRVGKFHDVEDSGRILVLIMPDGSKVKASYLALVRHEQKKTSGTDDIITEIR